MKWGKARLIARKFAKIYAAYVTALPILWGILFPMGVFTIIAFLWFDSGFLWPLADPSLFLQKPWFVSWLAAYWGLPLSVSALVVLEAAFFTAGLLLFCVSFAVLVHGLYSRSKLVRKGPYRYIRHPQYLGLILIFLPLALYIPGTPDLGVRLGDLVSWVQFVFLMVAFSDWEDFHLRGKFPDMYPEYCAKTGFFLPRISPSKGYGYFSIFRHPKTRYALFIILYILIVVGLYFVFEFGPVVQYF
nr:methyltransferase [Candidatus Njordarchaeota archaeon]